MTKKAALIILDGWGIGKDEKVSALAQAKTPFIDGLKDQYPHAELVTYGQQVGLPDGQMGNSEVGHLNIGAGRIVHQELARINTAIEDDTLKDSVIIKVAIENAKAKTKRIHLMGLVSDGGVHSHIQHLLALCDILKDVDVEVYIHAFLDGRDTSPHGGIDYLTTVQNHIKGTNATIVTVIGRYFAMDRDNRWTRVKKAYDLLVHGKGQASTDIISDLKCSYENGVTDEFVEPIQYTHKGLPVGNISEDDTVIFYNFRTDRPREITRMLTQENMAAYDTKKIPLHFVTMTRYDASFKGLHIVFTKENLNNTIGEIVSNHGLTQVRIAETEKYPHVTFFFSGGRELPFEGEERIMVKSPDVATYDLQPEMSCPEVTEKLMAHVKAEKPDFICLNYANTDMVGHTGIMAAAITAAETVDANLSRLMKVLQDYNYETIIIADHGNSDIMINEDGTPHTAHTTNMVPVWYVGTDKNLCLSDGKLGDVAPTILHLMGVDRPEEMTGEVLLSDSIV